MQRYYKETRGSTECKGATMEVNGDGVRPVNTGRSR